MWRARLAVASLWVSQTARVLADCALGTFVVLEIHQAAYWPPAWQIVIALAMLPGIVLAPLLGAVSNSLPKPLVLSASAGYCLFVIAFFAWGDWLVGWGLICIGAALYRVPGSAMLPAAAQDSRLPLTRLNAWVNFSSALALISGVLLAAHWHSSLWGELKTGIVLAGAFYILAALSLLATRLAFPVIFPSDGHRLESPRQAVAGFFLDCRRVWRDPEARASLLALAAVRGLILGIVGAAAGILLGGREITLEEIVEVYLPAAVKIMAGVALGSLAVGLQRHPRRVLGLVPYGAAGLAIALIFTAATTFPGPVLCVALGAMWGLINVPLSATYQAVLPADARGNGMAIRNFADYLAIAATSLLMFFLARAGVVSPEAQLWLAALVAVVAAGVSGWVLLREGLEQLVELLIWPLYRIRAQGPGLHEVPPRGPLLVIANHSSWLDPVWVAKVMPRRVIPMMTSVFYDLPGLKPLMRLARVIRVQAATFRRDVPEIREAIAALDRGECVLLFPEGWMRRRDDQPVRQFGQGIALILKERPHTPVIVCWVEGGWGSYFSYRDGPPTKNKPFDWWRHIDIAIEPPRVIDPALIDDQRVLRTHLMQACLDARRHLGLQPVALEKTPADVPDEPVPET